MTRPFNHPASHGFLRVASASIPIAVADPMTNAEAVINAMELAHEKGASVIVFPRRTLTGNTAGDLVKQELLIESTEAALSRICEATSSLPILAFVGVPIRQANKVFDTALALNHGQVQATWFASHPGGKDLNNTNFTFYGTSRFNYYDYENSLKPANPRTELHVLDVPGLHIAAVVGDEMFGPDSPALWTAKHGATLVVGLGDSPAGVGRPEERRTLSAGLSKMGKMAFIYAGPGEGESTTNHAWDGHCLIYENGDLLAESERFCQGGSIVYADIDLDRIRTIRKEDPTFTKLSDDTAKTRRLTMVQPFERDWKLEREIERFPFVPSDPARLEAVCEEAFEIQVNALVGRLKAIGNPHPVLGVSGGLDSTHALLVCAEAMDRMGRPRSEILTYTLPSFATTDHTKNNAKDLSEEIGTTFKELDIRPTAKQMLTEMGHPFGRGEEVYDVTFENVQAGLRTDFLFRIANHVGGIVVGTGDLSELALGWCTYGVGDHMSHYSVNPGIPKTLMQHLIRWVIEKDKFGAEVNETLQSILDTEITPELIPTREGEVAQSTQRSIGPYELQDFNLYYLIGRGYTPEKVAFMAQQAWGDRNAGAWPRGLEGDARHQYSLDEIVTWLRLFTRRFFNNQFKRSALPDGPSIVPSIGLSPRGAWKMGSDISSRAWISRIDALAEELGLDIERK